MNGHFLQISGGLVALTFFLSASGGCLVTRRALKLSEEPIESTRMSSFRPISEPDIRISSTGNLLIYFEAISDEGSPATLEVSVRAFDPNIESRIGSQPTVRIVQAKSPQSEPLTGYQLVHIPRGFFPIPSAGIMVDLTPYEPYIDPMPEVFAKPFPEEPELSYHPPQNALLLCTNDGICELVRRPVNAEFAFHRSYNISRAALPKDTRPVKKAPFTRQRGILIGYGTESSDLLYIIPPQSFKFPRYPYLPTAYLQHEQTSSYTIPKYVSTPLVIPAVAIDIILTPIYVTAVIWFVLTFEGG